MVETRRATRAAVQPQPQPEAKPIPAKRPSKRARKEPAADINPDDEPGEHIQEADKPAKRARRRTSKKEDATPPNPADFLARVSSPWKIGAHVSAKGGVENTVLNAARVGANAFALFVKSQRKWSSPPLTEQSITTFKARMKEFGYDPKHVLPHGSYLINLGNPDEEKREKSYECFLDDLKRCEQLGLALYNFHPGSTVGKATKQESIAHIAQCINRAHKETTSVVIVIENMAGAGNIIGSQFEELRDIIDLVEDKSRIGVCLDTCHMFAAGYDISTRDGWEATLQKFDDQIGLSYLRGMHLNDSKTPLGSKKDRHENIGLGTLPLHAFHALLTSPHTQNLPLVLETPSFEADAVWRAEIRVLNRLCAQGLGGGEGERQGGEKTIEEDVPGMIDEIRAVVRVHAKGAETDRGKGKAASTSKTRAKPKGKGKKKASSHGDEDADSDSDGSCAHDED